MFQEKTPLRRGFFLPLNAVKYSKIYRVSRVFKVQDFQNSIGRINVNKVRRLEEDSPEMRWIMDQTSDCSPETDRFDRLKLIAQGLSKDKTCSCGIQIRPELAYCSSKCSANDPEIKAKVKDRDHVGAAKKRKQTMIGKYGVEYNSQRPEVKPLLGKNVQTEEFKEAARQRGYEQYNHIDRDFWTVEKLIELNQTHNLHQMVPVVGASHTWITTKLASVGYKAKIHPNTISISSYERTIQEWLVDAGIDFVSSDRSLIHPKELDILIPEHKLAIEVNGVYWHSEHKKDKDYHLSKTESCNENGVQLLQFWDTEFGTHSDIIRSMILQRCGIIQKIGARKCRLLDNLDRKTVDLFLAKNHMQGSCVFAESYGLEFDGELVAVMTVGKPRFRKDHDLEILRFATRLNTTVIGGFGKLLGALSGKILSYANRRWSNGNVYSTNGFELIGKSSPAYWYTKGTSLISRHKMQRHKIANGRSGTERELAQQDGFWRVYDCGNLVFSKTLT